MATDLEGLSFTKFFFIDVINDVTD